MAAFIGLTSWHGELTDEFAAHPHPDPASLGLPTEDDGSRDDPLLSGVSNAITAHRPDAHALAAAPTQVVIAVGVESADRLTGRTSRATAALLGKEVVVFPSDHAGFLGGEFGQHGQPEAFAARLRDVLDEQWRQVVISPRARAPEPGTPSAGRPRRPSGSPPRRSRATGRG